MTAPRGFTLIELMISLVLFSLAIGGVMSVAVTFSNGMREQRGTIGAEQASRLALVALGDAVRQVSPGVPSRNIEDATTCSAGALTVTNSATGPDQLDLIYGAGGVVTSTTSAYGAGTTRLNVIDAGGLAAGDSIVLSNQSQGHLLKITAVSGTTLTLASPCSGLHLPSGGYPSGALAIRAQHAVFSIAAVDGVPTLMMDPDAGGPAPSEPFAEGIEDLQVALGVDVDGDGALTERGASAGDDEWQANVAGDGALSGTLRALRLTIVARATKPLAGATTPFRTPAAEDRPAGTAYDRYRRRVLRSTIETRNLTGSP